jgi:hypothetical protein
MQAARPLVSQSSMVPRLLERMRLAHRLEHLLLLVLEDPLLRARLLQQVQQLSPPLVVVSRQHLVPPLA